MRRPNTIGALVALALFLCQLSAGPVSAADVSVLPSPATFDAADTVSLAVTADSVADLGGFEFRFTYDPAKLEVTAITVHPGFDRQFRKVFNNGTGAGLVAALALNNQPLTAAPAVLATIEFRAKALGTSDINLVNVLLGRNDGEALASAVSGGHVTITGVIVAPPVATLAGTPASPTNQSSATFTVGGDAVVAYKYALDGGVYSSETATTAPITLTGLSDGGHSIAVIGRNAAGTWQPEAAAAIALWTVDTQGPVFSSITPADRSWSSLTGIAITGAVSDAGSGVGAFTINGSTVSLAGGNFSLPVVLAPGANTYVLAATDAAGNRTRVPVTYYLDTVLPNVVVSTLPDGSRTSDATLNVSGMVSDADGIQTVLVGSDPVTVNQDGTFSASVTLVPGDNFVEVTGIDRAGNQSTVSRIVILDPAAPAVTVTGPPDNLYTARNTVDITGSAGTGATVTATDNAGDAVSISRIGDAFSGTANLAYGLNTITIIVTDPATVRTQTVKRTIFSDFRKPGLAITSPDRDVTVLEGSVSLAGLVTDLLTDVTVTVSAAGQEYAPAVAQDGSFSQSLTFPNEGIYPVVVTVSDLNGNTVTARRNVQFVRGSVVINRGASATKSTTVTIDLSYLPAVPATRTNTMQLLVNNTAWTAPMTFASRKTVTLPAGDGLKTISARFVDDAGAASAFYSDTIILDTKVPLGSITINNGAAVTTSADVTLSLAIADINSVSKMQFSNNGTLWSPLEPFALAKAWSLPATPYGTKKVYARFVDSSGKLSAAVSDTILYAASTTGSMTGQVIIKNNEPYTTTATVALVITVPGGKTQMRVSMNGTTWAAWETAKTAKSVILPAGDGMKTVYVQFRASTTEVPAETYSDSIILDTAAPKGTIQINSGSYSTNNRTVTLMLTASDLSGVKEMQFSLDGVIWTALEPFAGTKAITLPSGEGVKTVRVKFKDNAGKLSAVYSDTILVDTVAPVGKVLINAGATVLTSRNVTLSFSATGATYLKLSLDNGLTWADWEPYVTSKKVILPASDGTKTVNVRFRDATGNVSAVASAHASYQQADAPDTITIPDLDSDGTYSVLWSVSTTTGVTYVLQEATNSQFTAGLRTAYSGLNTGVNITARTKGLTYYYRVQAKKTGYESSPVTTGLNACNVGTAGTPAGITVPTADADGTYPVSWGASITDGATYLLEEATNATFTQDLRTVYSGSLRTTSIPGNPKGKTYYYRVKAQRTGFPDSSCKTGANGCKVGP